MTYFKIRDIDQSVVRVKLSNDDTLITSDVFRFSSENQEPITASTITSLQSVLECYSMRELTLNSCCFSDGAVTALCDLVKVNKSLTSIDFNYCHLSDEDLERLIYQLQFNTCLEKVSLNTCYSRFKCMLNIFELVSMGKLTPNVEVFPHFLIFQLV
ncbi:hypothetical protein GEMRC1_012634 [Eukaryota sp. GEM-RC1]